MKPVIKPGPYDESQNGCEPEIREASEANNYCEKLKLCLEKKIRNLEKRKVM